MTLKELRAQSGRTCAEVAERLAVTTQAMYRYENGDRRLNIEQVPTLSELYDVTVEELVSAAILTVQ